MSIILVHVHFLAYSSTKSFRMCMCLQTNHTHPSITRSKMTDLIFNTFLTSITGPTFMNSINTTDYRFLSTNQSDCRVMTSGREIQGMVRLGRFFRWGLLPAGICVSCPRRPDKNSTTRPERRFPVSESSGRDCFVKYFPIF